MEEKVVQVVEEQEKKNLQLTEKGKKILKGVGIGLGVVAVGLVGVLIGKGKSKRSIDDCCDYSYEPDTNDASYTE